MLFRSRALAFSKPSAAFLLAAMLGGCVTGTTIPNSPFLTAVVRLNPVVAGSSAGAGAANNAGSPLDANAALTDMPLRGSLSQTDAAPQRTPPPPPFIAPAPERAQVYPQLAAAQSNLVEDVAPAIAPGPGPKRANDTPVRGGKTACASSEGIWGGGSAGRLGMIVTCDRAPGRIAGSGAWMTFLPAALRAQ